MCSKVFMFLIGTACIYYQVLASEDVFIAELMLESNVTLEAQTIISVLKTTNDLNVTDTSGTSHTVTLLYNEVVADCLIAGHIFSCNCSNGYIWSNEVCYDHKCCRETTCKQNVSHIIPLCIAKVKVHINGSVMLNGGIWSDSKTTQLETAFEELNGFEYLNVTGERAGNSIADFEAAVSVKFETSKLQGIIADLEKSLGAVLWVDTLGVVTIESPETAACYLSSPELKCTLEEATDSAGWNMSKKHERFELNNGSVVKLNHSCSTEEYKSCVAVTLQKVTGIWAGTYECGFTSGSVRHTAKTQLSVALLPDEITLKINPLAVDCSQGHESINIDVTATILNSIESFDVWWSYMGEGKYELFNKSDGDLLVYDFVVPISCQKTTDAQYVNVTFKNSGEQEKSAQVDIPVIYEGSSFCSGELVNGDVWPKAPAGDMVINRTCAEGRVGYKTRTCEVTTWQPVFSYCVNQELVQILKAANNFLMGLGATQSVAMDIFNGLKNTTASDSDSSDTMADVTASISVLNVMAIASQYVPLQEDVLPGLVDATSNILNKTWSGVNQSVVHNMSSDYLQSVEGLVHNIKVNHTNEINSQNVELKVCSGRDCNVSVFDIAVNLSTTTGKMKTVAVKNLMDKLRNNYGQTVPTGLLLLATLEDNNDSSIQIKMDFPRDHLNASKPICVFWNTTDKDWSDVGCIVKTTDDNRTHCQCNHLTSFSVLMAKSDISTDDLDVITSVGLGVSVCSLLIFLIIESLVWSAVVKTNLSHFRHTALVNIAVFLLLANCSFLASSSPETLSDTWCLIFTVCKHLFYLAMFSWMLCMSVMLVHQLIFVFSPLRKRVFMFISSIVGYVCPILIVGSSYVYCKYTDKSYYDSKTCWLVFERLLEGSMHAFLLPVGTVILTNLFSMVVVILTLVKSSAPDGGKADDKETAKSILKVVVFLTPIFGVTWIIGFAQLMLDADSPMFTVAKYSFTILNSFQGLLILITGCFAEQKVREELFKLIMAKSKGKSDSMTNLTSKDK
ncbi:adhesion G-protein coupled receptor F3 [Chaetodon auriga]|uniref:adhesion G-protein coupled receptor F3 n=1 Tax=Chaetodon auriga TaxID=39042 RepID=UPI0040329D21